MIRLVSILPLPILVAAAGCARQSEDSAADQEITPTRAAVCLEGDDFVGDGPLAPGAAEGDEALSITAMRWEAHDGCERFVIDLGPRAETGAVGGVRAELLRDLGLVRIWLPGTAQVSPGATDTTFDGDLAAAAFAVRSAGDRSLFVDLHFAAAAEARLMTLSAPPRVVLDLRPAGGALPPMAATGDQVVVLQPRSGTATYPLHILGYARLFEANVVARIVKDGTDAVRTFTTATDWTEAWGYYEMRIDSGPRGAIELHVGDYSARDGSWQGVRVPLVVE